MKLTIEKVLAMLVVASFVLTSVTLLLVQGGSLTREEAIEISRNTPVVQEALNNPYTRSDMMIIEADYWNATYIRSLEGKFPGDVYKELPDDHGVWRVHWDIVVPGFQILHFLDELTGEILYESAFLAG